MQTRITMTAVIHTIPIALMTPKIVNNKLEFIDPLLDGVILLVTVEWVPLLVAVDCVILLEVVATNVLSIIFNVLVDLLEIASVTVTIKI